MPRDDDRAAVSVNSNLTDLALRAESARYPHLIIPNAFSENRMPQTAWEWILVAVVVVLPCLVARRCRRGALAAGAFLMNWLAMCGRVLVDPSGSPLITAILAVALGGFNVAAYLAPAAAENTLRGMLRDRKPRLALIIVFATILPLGSIELACRFLTWAHVLQYHRAIQTVWRSGADDWRMATITGDENREPDPVLLWRPVARKPFTYQRFKGPVAQLPKPADVVRVMCYGDSLTDGPPKGGWPTWLGALWKRSPPIPGKRIEVLNAGVAGYSSHQGLLRFLQEVDRYQPNLLLISFGWNDAAEAIGEPDKSFHIPAWPLVVCQRFLIPYRAYLVFLCYTQRWRAAPPDRSGEAPHPRVSIDDYVANLERFRAEALARGIPVIFLTRPHKLPTAELRQQPTWRHLVPDYNAALLGWAQENGAAVVDTQRHFELLPNELFSDECHFVPKGYELMAELIRDHVIVTADGSLHPMWRAEGVARVPANSTPLRR
jgi:lysophospholipase L1-like esterase